MNDQLTGEPALWAAFVGGVVQLLAAFWLPWDDTYVAAVNAVVTAAAGVYVAFKTRSADNGGSIKAAIVGFAQSGITLALVSGWHATPAQTAVIMNIIGLGLGLFVRQTSMPASARRRLAAR